MATHSKLEVPIPMTCFDWFYVALALQEYEKQWRINRALGESCDEDGQCLRFMQRLIRRIGEDGGNAAARGTRNVPSPEGCTSIHDPVSC